MAASAALYHGTSYAIYDGDCFVYSVVARDILAGKKLYLDTWDNKPPLAYLFYMAAELVRPGSFGVLQALLGVWLALGALAFVHLTRPTIGTASWVTALFLAIFPASTASFAWASTENIVNPFALLQLAIALRVRKRGTFTTLEALGVGALMTVCLHMRQNTLLFGLVPLHELLRSPSSRERWRALGLSAAGAAVTFVPLAAFIALTTDLHEYLNVTFALPGRFAAASNRLDALSLLRSFSGTELSIVLCLFTPWAFLRGPRSLVLLAVTVSFAVCVSPNRAYPHYLASLIPVAGFFILIALDNEEDLFRPQALGVLLALAMLGLPNAVRTVRGALKEGTTAKLDAFARGIDVLSAPSDRLLVIGPEEAAPYIYFASNVRHAHRIFSDGYFDGPTSQMIPEPIDAVLRDYLASPPTIFVVWRAEVEGAARDSRPNSAWLSSALLASGGYSLIKTFEGADVYRRSRS
jgi:hypothetical protein